MSTIVTVGDAQELPENPVQQELTHGGFRRSPYHQWMEDNADERHMGRELLRQTTPLDMAEQEGVSEIMSAASPEGSESYRTSKWGK